MKLKTGRRDSKVSVKADADDGIPQPQSDVTTVLNYFSKLGINTAQTVALLGTHRPSPCLVSINGMVYCLMNVTEWFY